MARQQTVHHRAGLGLVLGGDGVKPTLLPLAGRLGLRQVGAELGMARAEPPGARIHVTAFQRHGRVTEGIFGGVQTPLERSAFRLGLAELAAHGGDGRLLFGDGALDLLQPLGEFLLALAAQCLFAFGAAIAEPGAVDDDLAAQIKERANLQDQERRLADRQNNLVAEAGAPAPGLPGFYFRIEGPAAVMPFAGLASVPTAMGGRRRVRLVVWAATPDAAQAVALNFTGEGARVIDQRPFDGKLFWHEA